MPTMRLEGIHHITAITADARANVDFYARVLGLRLVKKTVNFDAPDVYHLYYADEAGSPGSVLTFFEFPGAAAGRAGAGMIHTIAMRVAGDSALDFWQSRLEAEAVGVRRHEGRLRFSDPEGLRFELVVDDVADPPLAADAPDIPPGHALLGFAGVRAYTSQPAAARDLLEQALGFSPIGNGGYRAAGEQRGATYLYDPPPPRPGSQGAGTVHHIAWSSRDDEEQQLWRRRVAQHGARPTPIIDRIYFHSVYFREPNGVLFELATRGPGFTVDEPLARLGEALMLPERYEPMRERLERTLTPLANPRVRAPAR
ncbi:MAG: ring-cleaving dioxygenase [Solirubrobacteraceae bacterium]